MLSANIQIHRKETLHSNTTIPLISGALSVEAQSPRSRLYGSDQVNFTPPKHRAHTLSAMTQASPPHAKQRALSGSPPPDKQEAVARLLEKTGFEITNENGQRKYAPKGGGGNEPVPKGSEVFVGKLPRDVFEDELVPLFEKVGSIREMRLMMEDGASNRGFAFVQFSGPDEAKKAIEQLNGHELRKGRCIGVCKSVDNCRLFVGGIPKTKTKEEILEEMKKVTDEVTRVILYSSVQDKTKNRGFAFVEYDSHKSAAVARRKLIPGKIPLFGHDVAVDWAEPEPDVDEETMSKVTILYARNLMLSTTEEKLRDIFQLGDRSLKVEKVKKLRDFAFVHYARREDAEEALAQLHEIEIDGSIVEVTWAKPADRASRPRSHARPGPPLGPFLYGPPPPGFDPFAGPIPPFANCAGRGGLMHRFPAFRARGRGAAGIRRFRNYIPNSNHPGGFKPSEAAMGGHHSPHYGQYPSNKMARGSDKGDHHQYPHEYVFMPVAPNPEGLESSLAMSGAPLMAHGHHARLPHSYIYPHPPPGYDEMPYHFAYLTPGPVSSY